MAIYLKKSDSFIGLCLISLFPNNTFKMSGHTYALILELTLFCFLT